MRACFLFPFLIDAGAHCLSEHEEVREGACGAFLPGLRVRVADRTDNRSLGVAYQASGATPPGYLLLPPGYLLQRSYPLASLPGDLQRQGSILDRDLDEKLSPCATSGSLPVCREPTRGFLRDPAVLHRRPPMDGRHKRCGRGDGWRCR